MQPCAGMGRNGIPFPFLERGTFFLDRKYRGTQIFFLRVSQSTAVLNPKKAVRSRSSCDTAILALERAIQALDRTKNAIQGLERAILALDRTKNAILALERAILALERAILLSNRSFV